MTITFTKTIIDGPTGEVTVRPMTDDEAQAHQAMIDECERQIAAQTEREAALAAARSSARAKLKALGLTDDEIAALIP